MIFTIDWEPYFCFRPYSKFWEENDPLVEEPTMYLLDLLRRHQIKAIWYCLGWLTIRENKLFDRIFEDGHIFGDHTFYHKCDGIGYYARVNKEVGNPFRAPKFIGQKRLYSGGFWFRALPYLVSKKLLEQSGVFYIHPHDVLLEHTDCGNPVKTFERRLGLKTVRDKLERLCREAEFGEPMVSNTY